MNLWNFSAHQPATNEVLPQPAPCHLSGMALTQLLAPFDPIALDEMQNVTLLDRFEIKYVMSNATLLDVLPALQRHYRLLAVAGLPLARYQTLYYDTPDFALYLSHHAGVSDRYKVRTREYVDSALAFLEVKHKTNKNRTVKHRIPIADPMPVFSAASDGSLSLFLQDNTPYPAQVLQPVLWNRYRRITLVGKHSPERITLDVDLSFGWQGREQSIPQLGVAEVKQAQRYQLSPFIQQMRMAHVRVSSFSKYCMGVTLLYPTVKANRFKKKQRYINKLLHTALWSERGVATQS